MCLTGTCRFGEASWNEMCFAYLFYYPRVANFSGCASVATDPRVAVCTGQDRISATLDVGVRSMAASLLQQQGASSSSNAGSTHRLAGSTLCQPKHTEYDAAERAVVARYGCQQLCVA